MSMKVKGRKKRNLEPLAWTIGAGVMLLILVSAYYFGSGSGAAGGMPAIAVDRDFIDYGDVHFSESLSFSIQVTNTGGGALRFTDDPYIEVRDGC